MAAAADSEYVNECKNEISARRATPSDYEAVVNMMEVYLGFDYMPTFYHIFLQSKRHAVYVAEVVNSRKLVGLANYRLGEDGKTVYQLSGRVHPEFQSRGVYGLIFNKFLDEFPDVTRSAFDGVLGPGAESFFVKEKENLVHHFRWNMLAYRIDTKSLQAWKFQQQQQQLKCTQGSRVVYLSPSAITNQLLTDVQRFLERFDKAFLPSAHPTWYPTPLNSPLTTVLLKHQLLTTNALVTCSSEQNQDADVAAGASKISALSLQYPYLLKTPRYDGHVISFTFVYSDKLSDIIDHSREQLRHLANVVATTRNDVFFAMSFPANIDLASVKMSFAENATFWPTGMLTPEVERKCFLVSHSNIRSQL